MIIFGWRGITCTKQTAQFYCPACRAETTYQHRVIRNFFTLYFIPIIPLSVLGEYIECRECKTAFHPDLLGFYPNRAVGEMGSC